MATYPGMSLGGEVRESVSLDEDDLSDVEDEVFIRDGKHGYKFVEDAGLKRPLMAPRRKVGRSDITSRLKGRPPCKALCKPCCYVFGALVVLIGLIVLVVILASMFPLPIDKIKSWIVSKTSDNVTVKILPCSDLKVTDVWTVSLPKFISESPIRAVDVNSDGVDDFIFGYGTALENALHPNLFCPIFMGVSPPCEGGVIALNGIDGKILWRRWFLHSIFSILCTVDINNDGVPDCLVAGKGGILSILNSKDGKVLWTFEDNNKDESLVMDVYTASFIPDQNKDEVADILAAHTGQKERTRDGHLFLISGSDGKIIQKISTPGNEEIYYMPQVFNSTNGEYLVLFGTGSPTSPGNLSVVPLRNLAAGNMTAKTLYEDKFKGLLSSSVLVDITGDGQVDIITAAFNSTVIAFDGATLKQLWNITIPNSETLSVPIPGYFNNDNVTDFFVKYQTGKEFPLYFYSQAYIIDGRNGTRIYDRGIIDTMGSQMGGLTLAMEGHGFDMFLYWIVNCVGHEGNQTPFQFNTASTLKQQSNADLCKLRFNSTTVTKLYALNQYDQPPGLEVYTSDNRTFLEFKGVRTAVDEAIEYFKSHPENDFKTDTAQDVDEILNHRPSVPNTFDPKYNGGSSFRHKGNRQGIIKDFSRPENKKTSEPVKPIPTYNENINDDKKFDVDYDQQNDWSSQSNQYDMNDPAARIYDIENPYYGDPIYNPDQFLVQEKLANRDPRSKIENLNNKAPIELKDDDITIAYIDPTASSSLEENKKKQKTLKKNLSEIPTGIYGYKNIHLSRNRLLHDLNSSPKDILTDTYFKNRERQLRKSRFEQRDLKSHKDKLKDNKEVKTILQVEKEAAVNVSENLWDLESEKEAEDRENGYWRNKRSTNISISWIPKITSMGVLTNPINNSHNAIDLVFLTYWLPPKNGAQVLLDEDIKCIADKLKDTVANPKDETNFNTVSFKDMVEKLCLENRLANATKNHNNGSDEDVQIPYYNQILQLRMGQMTVYKIRIECRCEAYKKGERCAKFLNAENQNWSSYLGKLGDGFFRTRN